MGLRDEEEIDVFDLNAGAGPSKSDDYGTETNVFSVEYDASAGRQASPAPPPVSASAPAGGEDEFDFSAPASASIDDDDDFPVENEGFLAKIKGIFAKPDIDGADLDFDAGGDFSDDGDFPVENEGFFAKIKGMFAKPALDDDADIDFDAGGDFSGDDDFPEEKEGFFAKIKGMFSKPADIDDYEDRLLEDYKPVLAKEDSGVFDMSFSAAPVPASAPAAAPPPPEFEAKPKPVAVNVKPPTDDDEFDLSAGAPPPPAPLPVTLPPPVFSRIAHVCLHVKDLGASVDFYTKLGFKKRFSFNKNGGLFGVYLEFGSGNFIEIFKDAAPSGAAVRGGGGLAHFCLETPDIDAAVKSLASRGIKHTPKKLCVDSTYQIWLKDPDGNEFEIHQYTPDSSQITGRDVEADW